MNEIKAVKLKLLAQMPKITTEVDKKFEDAFYDFIDCYGIPSGCNKILNVIEDQLDDYFHETE